MQELRDPKSMPRINWHSQCLKARYDEHVWRLGIDAGFTCPHRSPDRLQGGCRFCAPDGNISAYQKTQAPVPSMEKQIELALIFTRRRYHANAFFLYFQAYTGTNAATKTLTQVYENAIDAFWRVYEKVGEAPRAAPETHAPKMGPLKGIIVSTRPDCFDQEKADLLAAYMEQGMEVWVELGLQSAHEETLSFIRRNHGVKAFLDAMEIAKRTHLKRTVHLMLGLPGESRTMMIETAQLAASTETEGVKFHDFRIVKGSAFARNFLAGEITAMHPSRLPGLLADCLEVLPPSTEIMRISADFRPEESVNIHPPTDKHTLARLVEDELVRRNSCQGQRFAG
ncbi:putative Radical SAM protein [uncultured spirochete]|uniref:Putative Radical SAM protein n=1 Tax=uncultured spirochete TaxID=156406 RepID=A0A3P3XPG2_9SPIR|nr:putative Radical SAM protein [uncultured spirochete]